MNSNIYIKEWLLLKPYDRQTKTDLYYLRLCNEIKQALVNNRQSLVLQTYLIEDEINFLSCFLTSYFEDLISGTNIWNSFVRIHKRLYNKPLPFFKVKEYIEGEVNTEDIALLIWYFLNTIQIEKFIAPFNDFIISSAEKVYPIFENEWEYAPENEHLLTFYKLDEEEDDYYAVRNLIDVILFDSYLFSTDTGFDLIAKEIELIESIGTNKTEDQLFFFLKENRDILVNTSHSRLLNLSGKEWLADILGDEHPLSSNILEISERISGLFLYKGQGPDNIYLEHIASGKNFDITKKSFDHSADFQKIDTIVFIGIVKWMDEWWFSGVETQIPFDPDIILDEKNSVKSRMAVNFLDHHRKEVTETLENQLKAFLEYNNGSQIAFIKSDQINAFTDSYTKYYNNFLGLTEKEKEESQARSRKDGFFGTEIEDVNYPEDAESALVFFNPKSGIEIAFEVNSAFPLPNNPFFKEESSEEHIMHLLIGEDISTELAMFCIQYCKAKLPFFNKGIGKIYLDDIDFLLRFWKKENYHSKPSITIIGK